MKYECYGVIRKNQNGEFVSDVSPFKGVCEADARRVDHKEPDFAERCPVQRIARVRIEEVES